MFRDGDQPVVGVNDVIAGMKIKLLLRLLARRHGVPRTGQFDRFVVDAEFEFVEFAVFADHDATPVRVGGAALFAFDGVRKERVGEGRKGIEFGAGVLQQLAQLAGRALDDHIGLCFAEEGVTIHLREKYKGISAWMKTRPQLPLFNAFAGVQYVGRWHAGGPVIRVQLRSHIPGRRRVFERGLRPAAVLAIVLAACLVATPKVRDSARGTLAAVLPRSMEQAAGISGTAGPASAATTPSVESVHARGEGWRDPLLEATIADALAPYSGGFSVVVRRLDDGRSAELNPDAVYYAASTFKLAILYEAERRISAGELALTDRLQLTGADFEEDLGTSGSLQLDGEGTISVGDALFAMITRSDNTTAVAFLHRFGGAKIDGALASLGISKMSVNTTELPVTAADIARLMEALVSGEGLSEAAREHARGLLLGQTTRWGVPSLLPADVPVGNKTGTWPGATHDVAFVEAPGGTYVIAVLTDGDWAWEPIAAVSAAVYRAMGVDGRR